MEMDYLNLLKKAKYYLILILYFHNFLMGKEDGVMLRMIDFHFLTKFQVN